MILSWLAFLGALGTVGPQCTSKYCHGPHYTEEEGVAKLSQLVLEIKSWVEDKFKAQEELINTGRLFS